MPDPILNPSLPADHAPIVASELRGQFQALANRFARTTTINLLERAVSNPPTQAEVQAIADKVDELIIALNPD